MTASTKTKGITSKLGLNQFKFSGKITKKDIKFSVKGTQWGSVRIEIPGKEEKYKTSFFVKVFGDIADKAENELNEGQNVLFYGFIKNNSYVSTKTGDKVYGTDFVAAGFSTDVESVVTESFPESSNQEKEEVPF